jgi:hypothetical protein
MVTKIAPLAKAQIGHASAFKAKCGPKVTIAGEHQRLIVNRY